MKNRLLSIIFLCVFLAACAPQPANIPAQTSVTAKVLPVITNTDTTPATSTPASIPLTSTPAPNSTERKEITEECISIEQKLPDDLNLSGVWVINEGKPYLENLADHMVYEVPLKGGGIFSRYGGDMAISPDGTHMAYIDDYYDANHRLEKRILRVMRSSGHSLDMSYWVENWQWIIGWVDDQNLAISTHSGDVVVLNPITGVWHEFQQPNKLDSDNFLYWDIPMYSPTLEWIASDPDYNELILKNVKTGKTVWQAKGTDLSDFSWATKNSILVTTSEKVVIILKDNLQEEYFALGKFGYERLSDLELSPNGEKLAFNGSKDYKSQPALLDLESHRLARLCTDDFSSWSNPVWSPDSRFVVQEVHDSQYQSFDILIDTQTMHAYLLKSGYYQHRIAWLAQP